MGAGVLNYTTRFKYIGSNGTTTTKVNDTWDPIGLGSISDQNGNKMTNFPTTKDMIEVKVNGLPVNFTISGDAKPNECYSKIVIDQNIGDNDIVEFIIYERIV